MTNAGPAPSANRQIARAAGVVMLGFVLSNLTSLARTIITADVFGAGPLLDAFNAAQRLPDILFSLVAGGALASAFIPTLAGFIENEDREGGWQLTSAVINLVLLALTVISALTWVFARPVVGNILAPSYTGEQLTLTVQLLRIMLAAPIIFGVSGLFMGVLNTHQKFWLPALAPTMLWLGMIFGLLVWSPTLGIFGLAWGYVLGALLHFAVQLPGILRLPARRYRLTLGLHLPAVREVGRLMAPRLLGVAVVQLNFLVNVAVSSGLPGGSLSAIDFAWRIMTMPQVVIAQAISIAALPTFSAQVARGKLDEMRSSLAATLRGILLLSIPATVGLILLRTPVIALLYQRGEFSGQDTAMVAWALLWYTAGLVGHSLVEILSRAFYALHDTKTPVIVGSVAMSLNVIFSLTFPAWFARLGWMPLGGLALSNTLASALESVVLLVLMRGRLNGLNGGQILKGTLQAILASAAMAGVIVWWLAAQAGGAAWLLALGGIALGGLLYAVLLVALKVPEVAELLGAVRRRLKR